MQATIPQEALESDFLPEEKKKELASRYLAEGEMALLQGNLRALPCFEAASNLDGANPMIWHRQGLAFFEYGSEEGKEKALLLASKNFKIATQLNPNFFEAWVAWGNVLLQLGKFHEEHHFLIEAKQKYQKALEHVEGQSKETLAELYWDYGIAWSQIAKYTGEALDIRLAIDAFQTAKSYLEDPAPEFYNDCGLAYLEMGLLTNDARLYLEAIDYMKKAVEIRPHYFDGLLSLAEGYCQLYINSAEIAYAQKAFESYASATKIFPKNPESWLGWGQILGEVGKHTKDPKLLRLSIEKCARAAQASPKNPEIIAQWVESLSRLGMETSRLDCIIEAEHKIIKATDRFPDDPELWHAYGISMMAFARYYDELDFYEAAIEKLQNGLSIDRTDPEIWHTLGLVHKQYAELTQDSELIERSCRFLTKAMDLKPSCPMLLFDAASAMLLQSELLEDLPSLEQAISLFSLLLQNHKNALLYHPQWLFEYGKALACLGDFTDEEVYYVHAIEVFCHVLLIDPDYPAIHHQSAICYVELGHLSGESEYYQRALHYYRLAQRQDPESEQVWLDWGICLIYLAHHALESSAMHQLYMDAEIKIQKAGLLGSTQAYYTLAALYSILGRTQESMTLIQRSLELKSLPSLEEILEDEWLENVRGTSAFVQFFNALEEKLGRSREE